MCLSYRISRRPLPSLVKEIKQQPTELTIRTVVYVSTMTYLDEACYGRNAITYEFITNVG